MNKLSYHLILVNSSLRVLIDQVEQLCECIETHNTKPLILPVQNKKSVVKPKVCEKLRPDPSPVLLRDMQARSTSSVISCDMQVIEKTSIINSVYESIKRSRKGIAFKQIQKKTEFNRRQIANAIYKLKEKGMIRAKRRGVYVKRKCAGDSFQGAVKSRIL